MLTMNSEQECPVYFINIEQPPIKVVERYIEYRFKEHLKDVEDDQKYKKVENLVQGYFLHIHELAITFDKKKSLDANIDQFRRIKIEELRNETLKFFKAEDIFIWRDEISEKRKKNAVRILNCMINKTPFDDTLPKIFFDTRYLLRESEKMQPLHPFVIDAYRMIFAEPELMSFMIQEFKRDAPVLGFILENIINVQWRKLGTEMVLTSFATLKKTGEKIQLSAYEEQDHCYPESFELDKYGFYIPAVSNFALYDAFISEPKED